MPTRYPGTLKETLALNTFIKLTRASESVMSRLARRNTHPELSPTQFGVMETLLHLGPLCQSELGEKLLKSGGNITLVIDNLEKRGLVQRRRDTHDRRMIYVSLTDTGETMIRDIFPSHVSAIVEEMDVLTPQEQDTLGKLCRKLGKQEQT